MTAPPRPDYYPKLYHQLTGYNKEAEILEWPESDPGDMSNEDAKYLMKEIGL